MYLLAFLLLLGMGACTKEGTGGKASVSGTVAHHGKAIPNAVVYIKYGAKELPGTSADAFDDHATASTPGALYSFEGLKKGYYYLYSVGYDSTIAEVVTGGIPIVISDKHAALEKDIPVTE